MRNLQAVSLAIVVAFAAVPTFAANPAKTPAALPPGGHAVSAGILNAIFAPAVNATPATIRSTTPLNRPPFYGYCSQDCRSCYSGDPYPQCPPDIYEGSAQSCLPFQGC